MGDAERSELRAVVLVAGVVMAEIALSILAAVAVPFDESKHRLLLTGTVAQLLGVFLVAWPDLESQAKRALSATRRGVLDAVRAVKTAWRQGLSEARHLIRLSSEVIANLYRRLRSQPQIRSVRVKGVLAAASGVVSAHVIRAGSLEERLERVENEFARMPGQWRRDMSDLRDRRIEFRWFGVSLILVGILFVGIASW